MIDPRFPPFDESMYQIHMPGLAKGFAVARVAADGTVIEASAWRLGDWSVMKMTDSSRPRSPIRREKVFVIRFWNTVDCNSVRIHPRRTDPGPRRFIAMRQRFFQSGIALPLK